MTMPKAHDGQKHDVIGSFGITPNEPKTEPKTPSAKP